MMASNLSDSPQISITDFRKNFRPNPYNLYRGLQECLAPEGALEDQIVKSLVDDQWRMTRATSLESSIFTEGAERFAASSDATGDPEIDLALFQGRVWQAEAKNLNLLSLYTSRFHSVTRRIWPSSGNSKPSAALEQAIEEAALLAHLAKSKGETDDMAESFTRRNFEFSTEEIARMISCWRRNSSSPLPASPRSWYDGPPAGRAREARCFWQQIQAAAAP